MSGTRRHKMTYTKEELQEAKRQIDSTLHKLRAFGLAVSLIERELEQLS